MQQLDIAPVVAAACVCNRDAAGISEYALPAGCAFFFGAGERARTRNTAGLRIVGLRVQQPAEAAARKGRSQEARSHNVRTRPKECIPVPRAERCAAHRARSRRRLLHAIIPNKRVSFGDLPCGDGRYSKWSAGGRRWISAKHVQGARKTKIDYSRANRAPTPRYAWGAMDAAEEKLKRIAARDAARAEASRMAQGAVPGTAAGEAPADSAVKESASSDRSIGSGGRGSARGRRPIARGGAIGRNAVSARANSPSTTRGRLQSSSSSSSSSSRPAGSAASSTAEVPSAEGSSGAMLARLSQHTEQMVAAASAPPRAQPKPAVPRQPAPSVRRSSLGVLERQGDLGADTDGDEDAASRGAGRGGATGASWGVGRSSADATPMAAEKRAEAEAEAEAEEEEEEGGQEEGLMTIGATPSDDARLHALSVLFPTTQPPEKQPPPATSQPPPATSQPSQATQPPPDTLHSPRVLSHPPLTVEVGGADEVEGTHACLSTNPVDRADGVADADEVAAVIKGERHEAAEVTELNAPAAEPPPPAPAPKTRLPPSPKPKASARALSPNPPSPKPGGARRVGSPASKRGAAGGTSKRGASPARR